jgi:hypothetical protein
MTLREKLQEEKLYINPHSFKLTKEGAESFEKIADDYAVNFANWYHFMIEQVDNLNSKFTPKELIEMFKKEKGL